MGLMRRMGQMGLTNEVPNGCFCWRRHEESGNRIRPRLPGVAINVTCVPNQQTCVPTVLNQRTCVPTVPNQRTCVPTVPNQRTCVPTVPNQQTCVPTVPNQRTCVPTSGPKRLNRGTLRRFHSESCLIALSRLREGCVEQGSGKSKLRRVLEHESALIEEKRRLSGSGNRVKRSFL